jgi:hypothetical protein
MTRDSYISGNIDIGAGPQVDLFSQQGFSGPEVARKLEEILVRNTTKVRSNPRGAVSSEFRAYLSANPEFRNLSPKQQQNAVETLLKRRFSGVTSLDHLSARISGQAGTANQFNTEVSNLADSAIATTVAAAAAKGNTAAADDVVKALANELQANTAMQSYGVTEGAQAEVLARNILEQRAATLGGAPAGAKGDLGGYLSRLDPKQITGGRPAGLTGQERAIEQQLQRVGTEARTAVKNQQASGAGQYTVTSRQLDEATQAGGSLDQIGVRVRGDVLDNSKLLQNVGNLDDMAGAVSPTVRNEALLNARTAVSAEINRVNAEIGEEIARAVNANGGDGAAVLNQINRSGGLREVGDVIAAGGVGGRAVNEANLAQQLTGIGVEAQLANELAAPGSAVFDRISTLTSEAASNASKSVNAVRNSLAEAGGGLLGSRTTGAMNRVNQQLTTQISTIGDDAAALAQENMRLLQQSMPRNAQGQTAALGLIDDLGEGLARGDTTAVKTFNDAVANLRSGSPVTYTEAVTSRAGTVTRQTRDIKLDGDDLRNFQQGYGSLRGATPESVNQLRTQVSKNPVQLIDNPNMSSALDNVTGSTAARDLVRNNGDIAGKLINNQTLSLNERAKLISDAGQTASLSPQQQTMLSTLARGQKLAKNTDSNDIAALETAINNELQNVPGYSQLRNLDMARLFEEASSNQRAFEAYVAAPTAPQRGFVDRLRTVAAAGAPPDPRATNYMAAPLSAGVMGGGAYAANATASYGMSALTAPVKGRYTKTAVALEEEALSDPGMSPMEPPVFQPPSPKGDMAALLSMGVLGVGTSEKSSSFMAAPVLSRPAV